MPTAAFTTLGCKVNQYETQKILESFAAAGFAVVPFEGPADVYVINTCSVTSDAERKSRKTVRQARRHNPLAKVVATGCAAQMNLNQGTALEDADLTVPNPEKLATFRAFAAAFPSLLPTGTPEPISPPTGRTRATLKVQDGCSVHCSYCSIPFTRPGMSSRPWLDVLQEAQFLARSGYQEAVLTGVLIGAYGPETGSGGPDFEDLVVRLSEESGLARIRISSIELHQVTDRLLSLAAEGKIVPHFHIPLQAGSSEVLRDMNRRYDQPTYIRRCHEVQAAVPDVALTTDILVGFPTETDAHFKATEEVCEAVGFLKAHVFPFSPRWGTPADAFGDPVPFEEKTRRRQRLMAITQRTGEAFQRRFLGRTMEVLLEGKVSRDGVLQGLTTNYLTVKCVGDPALARTRQWVRLDEVAGGALLGEIVAGPARLRVLPRSN